MAPNRTDDAVEWDVEESSFGPPAPWTGTVTEAQFVTDPQYGDGEVYLAEWTVRVDECDDPEWKGEEHVERWAVGKGWESNDRGKTVEHPSGKKRFHAQSYYGRIVAAVLGKGAGFEADLGGVAKVLQERGNPAKAAIWEGLAFEFDRAEFDFGGEIGVKTHLMPVKFVGEGGKGGKGGGKGKGRKTEKVEGGGGSEKKTRKQLVAIAEDCEDHDEFLERALAETDVEEFPELLAEVQDEDEFWAEHGE